MKFRVFMFVFVLFTLTVSIPLSANTTLRKTTGEEVIGELIKFENGIVTLKTQAGEIRVPLDELDNQSKYTVQKQFTEPDKPNQHIKLAEFCIEKQLYKEAIEEIILAGDVSEKILERAYQMLVKARLLHADSLRNNAKKKYEEKKFLEALVLYKSLYQDYPDAKDKEDTAKEIKRLQELIGRPDDVLPKQNPLPSLLLRNFEKNKPPNDDDKDDEEISKSDKKKLEKQTAKYKGAVEKINEGWEARKEALKLNATSEYYQKIQKYEEAEIRINEAIIWLDQIIKESAKYEFMKSLNYDTRKAKSGATDRMIEIAKDMMHLYCDADSPVLDKGLLWLNKVLAYSPFDEEARDLRKTITESILIKARK